jgi:hypothetical protein
VRVKAAIEAERPTATEAERVTEDEAEEREVAEQAVHWTTEMDKALTYRRDVDRRDVARREVARRTKTDHRLCAPPGSRYPYRDGDYRDHRRRRQQRRRRPAVGRRRRLRSGGVDHVAMVSRAETAAPAPETNHWPVG